MASIRRESSIAIIGSGAMGAGIAQVAAAAGHPVKLYDISAKAVTKAIHGIRRDFEKLAAKQRMTTEAAQGAASRVEHASDLRELRGVELVVEAVVEDLEIKRKLFQEMEAEVAADCILTTNTSSLSITAIAAGLKRPGRVVGMHFFNPAPVMKLVEVVSGLATDHESADVVYATAAAWGKSPVHVKSTPGFIVNRVARPYYGEALRLLSEAAASPASIDAIMREAGGFRMGPFELMDLIGLDVNFAVTQSVFEAYFGDPRYRPSLIQRDLVEAGFLGRKSGRGFHFYGKDAAVPEIQSEAPVPKVEGGPLLREELAENRSISANGVEIIVTDGRTATQRANESGVNNLVLVDLAFHYQKATRIAVARAAQCSEAGYRSALGLLQAAGFSVTPLRDLPGLAVMRTVAMLVNEAADAVNQGVATVAAVNTAMEKGVNYPVGPLAWADSIGIPKIYDVLKHLGAHYGEDRYRVSPLIRELLWRGSKFDEFNLQ